MVTVDETTIGGRIRSARSQTGMNIRQLSEKVGVTATYLGIVKRGCSNSKPSPALIQKIANVTGKEPSWFYTDNPTKQEELSSDLLSCTEQLSLCLSQLNAILETCGGLASQIQTGINAIGRQLPEKTEHIELSKKLKECLDIIQQPPCNKAS